MLGVETGIPHQQLLDLLEHQPHMYEAMLAYLADRAHDQWVASRNRG